MASTGFYNGIRWRMTSALPRELSGAVGVALASADLAVFIGRSMFSPFVSPQTKAYVILAGLYTGSGFDLVPEALLGPVGLADDSIVVLEAIHRLLNETHPDAVRSLWPGDLETLACLQRWVWTAREAIARHIVRPLAAWIRRAVGRAVAGSAA